MGELAQMRMNVTQVNGRSGMDLWVTGDTVTGTMWHIFVTGIKAIRHRKLKGKLFLYCHLIKKYSKYSFSP